MITQITKSLIITINISISTTVFAFNTKEEHNQICLECHKNSKNYNHDEDFYEARSMGKLKSISDLNGQINRCSNFYGSAWFPEEEAQIVKYLNNKYYQFIKNEKTIQASNTE
jgi:hypothetical protein